MFGGGGGAVILTFAHGVAGLCHVSLLVVLFLDGTQASDELGAEVHHPLLLLRRHLVEEREGKRQRHPLL
jgi:hypothetical protein